MEGRASARPRTCGSMSLRCRTARVILMAATRKSPLPVRVSRGHGYSGCRLVALRQENQPYELQHPSDQIDNDPSEERPKQIQYRHIVELQQNRRDPNGEEREIQHSAMPLNSAGFRRRTSVKLRMANGTWQTTATPLHQRQMDSDGRLYCQQKNRNDGIGEGENGVTK
jgi:hypothetical protein